MKILKNEDKMLLVLAGETCDTCKDRALKANTTDGATEKHIPECTFNDGVLSVCVGSVEHPMSNEHNISWILVETKDGHMFKNLNPVERPIATFNIKKEDVIAVYEYCNLHGLWKKEIN